MSAAFRRMKLFGYALVLAAFALTVAISAPSVAAQEDDMEDPTISISPSGGTFTNPSRFVSIQWCDNMGLNGSSRVICQRRRRSGQIQRCRVGHFRAQGLVV